MSFKITCTCGRQFGVKDQYAGKKGKCPHCGTSLLLQPDGGAPSAPASRPAPASTPARSKPKPVAVVSADDIISVRRAAPKVVSTGEVDVSSQMAGIRHIVQRFCPTCGTRYNEGQARCSSCHAPLSEEEIKAAAVEKNRKPLIPWLPRVHLSKRAKWTTIAISAVVLCVAGYFLFLHAAFQRKGRLQTELTLVEQAMTTDNLLRLALDMPGYPWNRPATVKAVGKWERHMGAGILNTVGTGTYDLEKRELVLTGLDGGNSYTYEASLPPLLHVAATAEDTRALRMLLDRPGCDVNQLDARGATALHAAAKVDQTEAARLLLDHGADSSIRDATGMTPLAVALGAGNKKVTKILRSSAATDPSKVILLPD